MAETSRRGGGGRITQPQKKSVKQTIQQAVRARNEDDDGYDPYSDFHDQGSSELKPEEDPWADK